MPTKDKGKKYAIALLDDNLGLTYMITYEYDNLKEARNAAREISEREPRVRVYQLIKEL